MTHSFHVLGTPEVRRGDVVVVVGHARQLSVLAVLLVDVNQVVSVDKLLSRVWGDAPPRQAKAALYSLTLALRVSRIMASHSRAFTAIGFSHNTCSPARAARIVYSLCM